MSERRKELMRRNDAHRVDMSKWVDMEALCWDIASGVKLVEWCQERELPVARVMRWIEGDQGRSNMYLQAEQKSLEVMKQQYIKELWDRVRADPADAYDEDGRAKPLFELPLTLRRMIEDIKRDKDTNEVLDYKFARRSSTLDQLSRALGVNVEHRVTTDLTKDAIESALDELAERRLVEGGEEVV